MVRHKLSIGHPCTHQKQLCFLVLHSETMVKNSIKFILSKDLILLKDDFPKTVYIPKSERLFMMGHWVAGVRISLGRTHSTLDDMSDTQE